jgi:hypothetical protein
MENGLAVWTEADRKTPRRELRLFHIGCGPQSSAPAGSHVPILTLWAYPELFDDNWVLSLVQEGTDMKAVRAILLSGAIACALWSPNLLGQDVHVTSDNGVITLSLMAQKPYALMVSGQAKTPVLSVVCQQKGKKTAHAITFSPGGIVTEQEFSSFGNSASLVLEMTLAGHKQSTTWISHGGNLQSFDYVGKTEPERIQFLQVLLSAPTVSIDFTPFLTGTPTSSTFDLTGLRTEFDRHLECAIK